MACDYYRIDQRIPEAGVRILDIERMSQTRDLTIYRVRRYCCGREQAISHKQINFLKNRFDERGIEPLCKVCQNRHKAANRNDNALAPYGVLAPLWPVPQTRSKRGFFCSTRRRYIG